MGLEYAIYCNGCGRIIDASRISARQARRVVRDIGGKVNLPGGMDLCPQCVANGEQPI